MTIFNQSIKTEDSGMTNDQTWYDFEDIYQAFKDRMIKEILVQNFKLVNKEK